MLFSDDEILSLENTAVAVGDGNISDGNESHRGDDHCYLFKELTFHITKAPFQ